MPPALKQHLYNRVTESTAWRSATPSPKHRQAREAKQAEAAKSLESAPLEQIQKDLRILNQIASRLVISCNEQPVLRVDKPQDIEVVPNIPMVFTSKVINLPTPVKFHIKYADRQRRDLTVYVSFEPFKDREHQPQDGKKPASGTKNPESVVKYNNPTNILVHSKGQQASKYKDMISRTKTTAVTSHNIDSDSSSEHEKPKKGKRANEKRFVEPQVYIKFTSHIGCSIQVRPELPESREKINKMNLKNQKVEMQKRYEEVQ